MADLESQKQKLQTKLDELNELTPEEELAERLHDVTCTWNHTDGCDWHYGSWKKQLMLIRCI